MNEWTASAVFNRCVNYFIESTGVSIISSAVPVDKRSERVKAMFGRVAPRYDLLNHLLSMNIDRRWRAKAIRMVPPIGSDPILDICTGTGDLAIGYARKSGPPVKVYGGDFCPEMLEVAREKSRRGNIPVEFLLADAMDIPFDADTFQIVSCAFGLRNVSDTRKGLAEMTRVARVGGKVLILEFSRPKVPFLKQLYLAYFSRLLPLIGKAVSRNSDDAYKYLPESVMQFPDGEELARMMTEVGLEDVHFHPFTFGIATLYIGTKSGPESGN